MSYLLSFSEVKPVNLEVAGSKAVNLSSAFSKQRIPPSFVMTTLAHKYFFESAGVMGRINDLLSKLSDSNLQAIANTIQKLIIEAELPKELSLPILENYAVLGDERKLSAQELLNAPEEKAYVAVRASYVDMPLSKEGMHLSLLNIRGESNILTAIKVVYAAEYTARNILLRKDNGLPESGNIAVIVQKMVNPDKSVLVRTDDSSYISIKAIFGLGEGFKDKSIFPDEYIVEKGEEQRLKDVSVKNQVQKYWINSGKIENALLGELGKIQKLSKTEIMQAAKIAWETGTNKSIEIAICGEDFYIIDIKDIARDENENAPKTTASLEVYDAVPIDSITDNNPGSEEEASDSIKDEEIIYDSLKADVLEKQKPLKKTGLNIELTPKKEIHPSIEKAEDGVVNYDEEEDLREEFDLEEVKVYEDEYALEKGRRKTPLKQKKKEDEEEKTYYEREEYSESIEKKEDEENPDDEEDSDEKEEININNKNNKKNENTKTIPEKNKDDSDDDDGSIFSSLKTY